MGPRIYLDYQASTPTDPRVLERMLPFFGDKAGNPHAEHAFGWEAQKAVDDANQVIASELGCDASEIIFTSGATEANNLAILGAVRRAPESRRRILIGAAEHKSVLESARIAGERHGMSVELLPVDQVGAVSLETLLSRLGEDVLLVSIMAVNNEVGTLQPITELVRACHAVGALFHTDGTHSLTAGKVDLWALGVDLLSLSSHKIYGPKGIGALYVERDSLPKLEPLIYGGSQQQGLRSGTLPVPLCVGFGEAIRILGEKREQGEAQHIGNLRDLLISGLLDLDDEFRLNGPPLGLRHPYNVNICFRRYDARELLGMLQPTLAASTGSACTSGTMEGSHVLSAIGLSDADINASLRFGVGRFTSEDEIHQAIAIVAQAISRQRA